MLAERPASVLLGVLIGSVALALPVCAFMFAQTLGPALANVPAADATAYVASGTSAAEVKLLGTRLEAMEGVRRVRFIARDQAWAELQRRSKDGEALAEVKPNPLPDAFVLEFVPRLPSAALDAALVQLAKQPRVEAIQADVAWYRRVMAVGQAAANFGLAAAAVVLVLIAVAILGLVRRVVVVDRDELRLLDQIGAEDDFMRRPFIYAGATVLGIAAAGSLGLVAAVRYLTNPLLAELGHLFSLELTLGYPPWPLVVAFVAGCLLIGAGAANVFAGRQIARAKGISQRP